MAIGNNGNAREVPSPPVGERDGVRGRHPQYGKHRTRTADARDFARQLRKKCTDAEKRLWRLLRDRDRKSTRLNSSHLVISYAVFCLKKKKNKTSLIPK